MNVLKANGLNKMGNQGLFLGPDLKQKAKANGVM